MGFFGNAFKALDQFGHDIPKYAEHAAPMITGAASVISQESQRHAGYAARDFDWFVNSAGQEVIKNIDPNTLQGLGNFGEEVGKHLGATADDVWKALLSAHEDVGKHVGGALDNAKSFGWEAAAKAVKEWVVHHPELAVAIAAALAGSVAVMAVPPVLGALGFTEGGIVAGSIAAGIQAGLGNVEAGSLFAILQSAATGGSGAVIVNAIVGGSAALLVSVAVTPVVMEAADNGKDSKDI